MMKATSQTYLIRIRLFWLCLAVILLSLIITGAFDSVKTPVTGMTLDANHRIIHLDKEGPAAHAGLLLGDQILSINDHKAESGNMVSELGRELTIGQTIKYGIFRDGKTSESYSVTLQPPRSGHLIQVLWNAFTSLLILLVITYLIFRHPNRTEAVVYFLLMACYLIFRMEQPRWSQASVSRGYQLFYLFIFFVIPALFLHFGSLFPRKNLFIHEKPKRIRWAYLPSLTLFIPAAVVHWLHFDDFHAREIITQIIIVQGFVIWAVFLTAGSLMMIKAFFRVRSRILARRVIIFFYSLFFAVLPYLAKGILDLAGYPIFPVDIVATACFFPFLLSLTWAIDFGEDKSEGLPWMVSRFFVNHD